ncbi:biotin--[acetyl-CoA-carboxylase] ligase [Neomoorella thermoacetica]|uniref:Bifunctional ligase/repressor BirA n=3 Tax=Neomoorella thermoacetica TaxID=1525 RepID=A0A0S6UAB8_NEOTH|nr:biotin--[acetyl-CoA-carboxylase] ligase [Moorella thermoacetica]AKX95525.1 bifunctional ligase/repressor BirA [Moorella thermoacetica]OIQ56981.1 bifunctional ligase/repressor BirA [Moorella thermoacetica]QCZ99333.1 Bifunctional ligase/repressor BirA [Moorella thermoacetica]TYL09017.1 Bifunctional ligase/repressor BirA [Moorella thermoacetica]TYL09951.1 Bifunctional ligase/repressor BirA [Moorella thermoacetica]
MLPRCNKRQSEITTWIFPGTFPGKYVNPLEQEIVDNQEKEDYNISMAIEGSKQQVLEFLRRHRGEYISGEDLSRDLAISRTAVWKHIQSLRQEGYRIDAQTRRGYCLLATPDCFYPEEVTAGLETAWLGRTLYYYDEVGSTNQVAKELADDGAPEGTVIVAECQTGGRGRRGRSWISPARKGIWFSVILRPRVAPAQAPQLTLLAAVAVVAAVRERTGLPLGIKWPNDLLAGGRKVCGILTEIKAEIDAVEYIVLGIGLNANLEAGDFSPEVSPQATSLYLELGRPVERLPLFQRILSCLEKWYERWQDEGFAPVREAWKEASITLGQEVRVNSWREVFQGVALDIDDEGSLLVRDAGGRIRRFNSGEVSLRPV